MRPRSVRVIAIALALIAGCAALLGWDLVYERHITDTLLDDSKHSGLDD
jgi:Flp pilus assembly protein CpaB